MFRESELTKQLYTTTEVANMLNVTTKTIQNYEKSGVLKCERTEGGHRRITCEELKKYLKSKGLLHEDLFWDRRDVVYARVSSNEQKTKGDLDRQALTIIEGFSTLKEPIILKEVGSDLNDNRKQLNKLLDLVLADQVGNVYVTYRDRLTRFGFHYLERVFKHHGTRIFVLNDEERHEDVSKALAEDMMALIASFSGKLYGMRSHKKSKSSYCI